MLTGEDIKRTVFKDHTKLLRDVSMTSSATHNPYYDEFIHEGVHVHLRIKQPDPDCWTVDQIHDRPYRDRLGHQLQSLSGLKKVHATGSWKTDTRVLDPRINPQDVLVNEHPLTPSISVFTDKTKPACAIYLGKGEASIRSVANCLAMCVVIDGDCWDAHAGLRSSIDFGRIQTGVRSKDRPHESVLHSIVSTIQSLKPGISLSEAAVSLRYHSSPEELRYPLRHPQYGEFNCKLYQDLINRFGSDSGIMNPETGAIDQAALNMNIAYKFGVGRVECGRSISSRKGFATDGRIGQKRNLFIAYRRS